MSKKSNRKHQYGKSSSTSTPKTSRKENHHGRPMAAKSLEERFPDYSYNSVVESPKASDTAKPSRQDSASHEEAPIKPETGDVYAIESESSLTESSADDQSLTDSSSIASSDATDESFADSYSSTTEDYRDDEVGEYDDVAAEDYNEYSSHNDFAAFEESNGYNNPDDSDDYDESEDFVEADAADGYDGYDNTEVYEDTDDSEDSNGEMEHTDADGDSYSEATSEGSQDDVIEDVAYWQKSCTRLKIGMFICAVMLVCSIGYCLHVLSQVSDAQEKIKSLQVIIDSIAQSSAHEDVLVDLLGDHESDLFRSKLLYLTDDEGIEHVLYCYLTTIDADRSESSTYWPGDIHDRIDELPSYEEVGEATFYNSYYTDYNIEMLHMESLQYAKNDYGFIAIKRSYKELGETGDLDEMITDINLNQDIMVNISGLYLMPRISENDAVYLQFDDEALLVSPWDPDSSCCSCSDCCCEEGKCACE